MILDRVGRAWRQLEAERKAATPGQDMIYRAFLRTGAIITANGEHVELICPEALPLDFFNSLLLPTENETPCEIVVGSKKSLTQGGHKSSKWGESESGSEAESASAGEPVRKATSKPASAGQEGKARKAQPKRKSARQPRRPRVHHFAIDEKTELSDEFLSEHDSFRDNFENLENILLRKRPMPKVLNAKQSAKDALMTV